MSDSQRTPAEILKWCAAELVHAHDALIGADRQVRARILQVAVALEGVGQAAEAELLQARRTAGGLSVRVAEQARDIRSNEDELGRLRPENAVLRERVRALEAAAWAEMVQLGQELDPPAA